MKLNIKSCLVAGMFSLTMASCSLLGPIDDIHPENVLDVPPPPRSSKWFMAWMSSSSLRMRMSCRTALSA